MPLKHADIWRAIDRLAHQNKLSPSGLARKAGLSPTVFNPSKRFSKKRKRWPSTESIAHILQATGTDLDAFVALAASDGESAQTMLPLLRLTDAKRKKNIFDADGRPSGKDWEIVRFPGLAGKDAFAIEITGNGQEPIYREGDRIILSPKDKPRRGDRVLVRTTKGDMKIGQLDRENAQKLTLLPLNPAQKSMTVPQRDIEWIWRIVWASQ